MQDASYAREPSLSIVYGGATDPPLVFGEALRDHRRAAGLTQEQLAERAGVSPRSISGLERGEGGTPRRDTVALLVRALGLVGVDREAFEATVVRRSRLRPNFPPDPLPQSLDRMDDRAQHNLPRSLTSFVGREQELSELGPILVTAPLVTLVGAGGIGKTRLAQELARLHAASFADGAWLVELAELTDPSLAASAVAAAVGLDDLHARNTTDMLTDFLRPKHVLLVLDNCEHLVNACADLVGHLLRMCPHLHVLATSREPLAIDGEITWLVRPLDLPDPQLQDSADQIEHSAAVRLFIERARAVSKAFVLTDDNASAIARVCIAVDGIPLGLELAAARIRLLAVPQLADRLEHDGEILSGPKRNGSPRHRTIRATIDWSHDLLGEREQILLRRLSVFAGGWTLEMAEDVCSGVGIERSDVLEVLAQLVDRSMVLMTACDGVARYRLLGPIRQYASERLEAAVETAEYGARHADIVLSLPRSGEVDDYGPDEVSSLDRFELEHANLRVALRWALDHDHAETALRAASALFRFWERRGHFQEGCAWLEEALASAGQTGSRYRGTALNALAFLCWRVGDVERAQPIAQQALAVNREIGSTLAVAWALGNLGAIAYFRDQLEAGVVWLEESVVLGRQAGYEPFLSLALTFLGRSLLRLNGPSDPRVSAVLQESLTLAEGAQTRYAMGHALMTLGDLNWRIGLVDRAVPLWHRALEVRSQIADRRGIAGSLERLAWGLAASKQFESAAWLFGAAHAQHALLGIDLRNDEQVDHAQLITVTREHLGDAFDSTWSVGQSSTVDEAVVLALEITRSNPTPSPANRSSSTTNRIPSRPLPTEAARCFLVGNRGRRH